METGPWDFTPGAYYWLLHKGYSGAKFDLNWLVNAKITFHEHRSDVKRVLPTRLASEAAILLKDEQLAPIEENLNALNTREVARSIARNVDFAYPNYKDDFQRLTAQCLELFDYIRQESKDKLTSNVTALAKELNIINEQIQQIHKTGVGYELESGAREKGYISAKKALEKLVGRSKRLALRANLLY